MVIFGLGSGCWFLWVTDSSLMECCWLFCCVIVGFIVVVVAGTVMVVVVCWVMDILLPLKCVTGPNCYFVFL